MPKINTPSPSSQQPTNTVHLSVKIDKVTGGIDGVNQVIKGIETQLRNKGVVFNI